MNSILLWGFGFLIAAVTLDCKRSPVRLGGSLQPKNPRVPRRGTKEATKWINKAAQGPVGQSEMEWLHAVGMRDAIRRTEPMWRTTGKDLTPSEQAYAAGYRGETIVPYRLKKIPANLSRGGLGVRDEDPRNIEYLVRELEQAIKSGDQEWIRSIRATLEENQRPPKKKRKSRGVSGTETQEKLALHIATTWTQHKNPKKVFRDQIRANFPEPTDEEIRLWNNEEEFSAIDSYRKRVGVIGVSVILQIGWQNSKDQLSLK